MSIQYDLNRVWFKYYTSNINSDKRVKIADAFIKRYEGITGITSQRFTHPSLKHKGRFDVGRQSIAEIFADFILRAEKDKNNNIKSRELELEHDDAAKKNNIHIYHGKEPNKEAGETIPYGYIEEDEYVPRMIKPRKPTSAQQVKTELYHVKQHPEFYALTFAEDYGKDYEDTLKRIRRLDIDRVRTCHQCGDGFYAHDRRRKVCDRRQGLLTDGTLSSLSMCDLNYKNNEESWRIKGKRQ